MTNPQPGNLLPQGRAVAFTDIEGALMSAAGDSELRLAGIARTATLVIAGDAERLVEAADALDELTDIGVRAVLISYGGDPVPSVRVSPHAVALEGLRAEYLNNAVAALRLSSLPDRCRRSRASRRSPTGWSSTRPIPRRRGPMSLRSPKRRRSAICGGRASRAGAR